MAGFADGDLGAGESERLRGHFDSCAECGVVLAKFLEMDRKLNAWGSRMARERPAPSGERERLVLRLEREGHRQRDPWVGVIVAVAAGLLLLAIVPQLKAPVRKRARGQAEFVEIPYLAPIDPRENASIVRMDIRVATLLATGYRIMADPDAIVSADVLVGEDGRAHAVRVISGVELKGTGD
jgi:hypothetical protein